MAEKEGLEAEIAETKKILEELKTHQIIFSNAFRTMNRRERVEALKKIRREQDFLNRFFLKMRRSPPVNTGVRFVLDQLKQNYLSAFTFWQKVEKTFESFTLSDGKSETPSSKPSPLDDWSAEAVKKYVALLTELGQKPDSQQIEAFESRLQGALESKGQDRNNFQIDVVKIENKIKVRLTPVAPQKKEDEEG